MKTHMELLCEQLFAQGCTLPMHMDLPRPNIYWCTARHKDHGRFDTYIAGDHTTAVHQKFHNWCAEQHGFRPLRSFSTTHYRRLKMGDILHNPAAYDTALARAVRQCESDLVRDLRALPAWIARECGVAPMTAVTVSSADALWDRMARSLEAHGV